MSTLKICIILLIIYFLATDGTPVLLWGAHSPLKPSLTFVRQSEFSNLIGSLLRDYAIVAFIEPNFTGKDFRCRNINTGDSCFTFMKNLKTRAYYANVEKPLESLKAVANYIENITLDEKAEVCTFARKVTFVNFNSIVDQSVLDRTLILQSHDKSVAAFTKQFNCPIVYLYFSYSHFETPAVRIRRDATTSTAAREYKQKRFPKTNTAAEGGYIFHHKRFILFFKSLEYRSTTSQKFHSPTATELPSTKLPETTPTETVATTPKTVATTPETVATTPKTVATTPETVATTSETVATTPETVATTPKTVATTPQTVVTEPQKRFRRETNNATSLVPVAMDVNEIAVEKLSENIHLLDITLQVTLKTGTGENIVMMISQKDNYFVLRNVTYKDSVYRRFEDISTISHMSYFCGILTLYDKDGTSLTFRNLQFQGFKTERRNEQLHFNEPWHCIGFISIGIAQGIFVMSILISIAFCGILWLMDLKTMSRFENPYGKPLVIRVDEK